MEGDSSVLLVSSKSS